MLGGRLRHSILQINGEPGLVNYLDGVPFSAMSFETDGRSILAVYNILNPEKLKGLSIAFRAVPGSYQPSSHAAA